MMLRDIKPVGALNHDERFVLIVPVVDQHGVFLYSEIGDIIYRPVATSGWTHCQPDDPNLTGIVLDPDTFVYRLHPEH